MDLAKLGGDRIFFGEDATSALAKLPSIKKRALIIMTGTILEDLGLLKPVTDALEKGGFQWEKFDEIEEDATFTTIKKGIEVAKRYEPDWIIGFGGGSAMDAAKTIWVFYENPEITQLSDVAVPNVIPKLREKARICCIPTSAGTGSEVTRAAVVKDVEKRQKFVIVCMEGRFVPDIAILDPQYSLTLPKGLTASTGADAMTHSIESFVCIFSTPYSEGLAISGFTLAHEYLPKACENGKDVVARSNMLIAANLGGIAFANSHLGITHSIAHAFGGELGVPHGLANAIIQPYIIEFNEADAKTSERYRRLASLVGSKSLLDVMNTLNDKIGIPKRIKDFVKDDSAFEKNFESIVSKAVSDICTVGAPLLPTPEQWKDLVRLAYYGK